MDKVGLEKHTSKQFDADLEDVRELVLAMGGLVEQQIADAVRALITGEGTLGQFLYDDRLYESTVATANTFQATVAESQNTLRSLTARADDSAAPGRGRSPPRARSPWRRGCRCGDVLPSSSSFSDEIGCISEPEIGRAHV